MKTLTISLLFAVQTSFAQSLTAEEILHNSAKYHDPQSQWSSVAFSATIESELEPVMANQIGQSSLVTTLSIDNSQGIFDVLTEVRDDKIRVRFKQDECTTSINGSTEPTQEQINKHSAMVNLSSCETAKTAINYHVFLMGLPMKLVLDNAPFKPEVNTTEFFGVSAYQITVTYPQDTWKFYFDKDTFTMIGCEFKFNQSDFGEKIKMEYETSSKGLKLATSRTWYSLSEDLLVKDRIRITD